jgi:hypothetical protein
MPIYEFHCEKCERTARFWSVPAPRGARSGCALWLDETREETLRLRIVRCR